MTPSGGQTRAGKARTLAGGQPRRGEGEVSRREAIQAVEAAKKAGLIQVNHEPLKLTKKGLPVKPWHRTGKWTQAERAVWLFHVCKVLDRATRQVVPVMVLSVCWLLSGCTTTSTPPLVFTEPMGTVGASIIPPEAPPSPVKELTVIPITEVRPNPSKPLTMTGVTVPEPDPSPASWGTRQAWVRDPTRVYPRLIQPRNEPDDRWIERMEERSKPRPSR